MVGWGDYSFLGHDWSGGHDRRDDGGEREPQIESLAKDEFLAVYRPFLRREIGYRGRINFATMDTRASLKHRNEIISLKRDRGDDLLRRIERAKKDKAWYANYLEEIRENLRLCERLLDEEDLAILAEGREDLENFSKGLYSKRNVRYDGLSLVPSIKQRLIRAKGDLAKFEEKYDELPGIGEEIQHHFHEMAVSLGITMPRRLKLYKRLQEESGFAFSYEFGDKVCRLDNFFRREYGRVAI